MTTLFVLFGISGDLSRKKIIPALYELFKQGKLKDIRVLGIARRDLSPDYIVAEAKPHIKHVDEKTLQKFKEAIDYFQLAFSDKEKYGKLAEYIKNYEKKLAIKNKVFYISTSPEFYEPIIEGVGKNNICDNSKIVIEKPFGEDVKTANSLNFLLKNYFSEKNIFRIDHYLGKDAIHELEKINKSEKLQILFIESFGIGTRGEYYDKFGAMKDVVQNHILQLIAVSLSKQFQKSKSDIIKNLRIEQAILGQYADYTKEKNIPSNSKTETLVAVKLSFNKISIYILAGKKLGIKKSAVIVKNKNSEKSIDLTNDDFPAEPYVNLITDVFSGKKTYFVSEKEIEEQWKFIEKIEKHKSQLLIYENEIPSEVKELIKENGWEWRV